MDELDNEGKNIYDAYKLHRSKWINYITPKALQKINTYLSSTGKLFDNNDYVHYYNSKNNFDISPKNISKESNARYKKLSLLFHPDKLDKIGVETFFSILNKFYKENNSVMLELIDIISHLILELPNFDILNKNLENPIITEIIKHITNKEPNKIFELFISSNIEEDINMLSERFTECIYSQNNNFLESICYKFFMDDPDIIQYINQNFLTESEIISKIMKTTTYNEDYIDFCYERYRDNRNILEAIVKWN